MGQIEGNCPIGQQIQKQEVQINTFCQEIQEEFEIVFSTAENVGDFYHMRR